MWIADHTTDDAARVGGKASKLARLLDAGQPVPSFFTITTEAFRDVAMLAEDPGALREHLLERALPEGLDAAIVDAYETFFDADTLVAVRSSAVGEDADDTSFAGLHDSFLFVRGADALLAAVRKVWASVLNPRAIAYRREHDLPLTPPIAVIVQAMVPATRSGVVFTAHPSTGDVHQVVVSALYGVGEGLVSLGLDADTFVFDKSGEEIDREIVAKDEMVMHDPRGGGVARAEVADFDRGRACLDQDELRAVVDASLAIENHFRCPQDIEFCFDLHGRLVILQSRPITTVDELGPAAGEARLWDNSNIVESYAGVTSAMTFSFIRHAYANVYHCFCEVMGITPEVIRQQRATFENMLGLFRGRVYYNLDNWYRLVRLFPGYDYNRGFMESMMGVSETAGVEDAAERPSLMRRYLVELPALLRLVARTLFNFAGIERSVQRFENHFDACYQEWSTLDMDTLTPHQLETLYREMETKLLRRWHTPIVNDFYVMVFYGLLKKLCAEWCGDEAGTLQNDLVCGEGGIESTEPTRMLLRIARNAHGNDELRHFLIDHEPEEIVTRLPHEPRFASFAAQIDDYLERYGFRCVDELKLEEPSLHDRPAFVFQILANYLRHDQPLDLDASLERERAIRRDAETRAFAGLGPVRRAIFRRVLAATRRGVKNRENLRFARTKVYGLLRRLLRAMGGHFVRAGVLDRVDDIFDLTLDEVWSYLHGTAVTTDLRALATLRRAEFDRWREAEAPDDRFHTYGLPYHRNALRGRQQEIQSADGEFKGVGCCPGTVEGPVKVVASPSDDARLDGEILVAERTDPGWVPLYPSVSGLLIERGSILSHSAIVAREMGLPTIVGLRGLGEHVSTGDVVHMDGATGVVEPRKEEVLGDAA
ncbi:MAG: PEP/pyruvate-binding domain-containing protein [Acidobacteriota bacterium]